MMHSLADEEITSVTRQSPHLQQDECKMLLAKLPSWQVIDEDGVKKLRREYCFKDYEILLALTTKLGRIAQQYDHHPEIILAWGKVTVTWWTHVSGGLQNNDFIMAAKSDRIAMLVCGI